jgi:hypothetical protein
VRDQLAEVERELPRADPEQGMRLPSGRDELSRRMGERERPGPWRLMNGVPSCRCELWGYGSGLG